MGVKIDATWQAALQVEFAKPYFKQLRDQIHHEYRTQVVYPPAPLIFNAFDSCPLPQVKVVVLGQDPYHGEGQAHGLSFSVNDGVAFPPSLLNIFKELHRDLQIPIPTSGNLQRWANQGVLLLNATLTVRAHQAGSHQHFGWQNFTDAVIRTISEQCNGVVFLLWGNYAQRKELLIDQSKHLVLKSVHPSPLSAHRGFIGCGHFSATNSYLKQKGKEAIRW